MRLGTKEREYLHTRLKMAYLWSNIPTITDNERNAAHRMANTTIDTIEGVATSASTLKRTIAKIVDDLERTA